MKNWIMRMPEPGPLGLTFLLAIARAMVSASLVNRPLGGRVETVFTPRTHFFFSAMTPPVEPPYWTQTVLMLTNSRMPNSDRSRP